MMIRVFIIVFLLFQLGCSPKAARDSMCVLENNGKTEGYGLLFWAMDMNDTNLKYSLLAPSAIFEYEKIGVNYSQYNCTFELKLKETVIHKIEQTNLSFTTLSADESKLLNDNVVAGWFRIDGIRMDSVRALKDMMNPKFKPGFFIQINSRDFFMGNAGLNMTQKELYQHYHDATKDIFVIQ